MDKKINMNQLTIFTLKVFLTVALGTVTASYVAQFLTPPLMFWLLYFVLSHFIIQAYINERSKKREDRNTEI